MSIVDQAAADDLRIFIDNDGALYRQTTMPILKNLMAKRARGEYTHARAVQAFMHLAEAGAKKYAQEAGGGGAWHVMFSVPTRKEAATQLARSFEEEAALGNYDDLLPKKYREAPRAATKGARASTARSQAKSKADLEREIRGAWSGSRRA